MNSATTPLPAERVSESVQKLIAAAREKFAAEFPGTVDFDAPSWDISSLKERSTNPAARKVYFTRRHSTEQPLPPIYANVLKSWIILDRHSAENMPRRSATARMLWEAALLRRKGKSEDFHWDALTEEDLSQAELLMRENWAASSSVDIVPRVLCLAYVSFNRYVTLFSPSLQWVPWPLPSEALRFPTFTGTTRS
jgi:hypothetical protein